ncbi:MAG: UbiX family flavin prenyltransferase [Prevotellaceae bacterium]|jgi:4-hydroxy-3-polyprenylbenzoate decarboxylase|nr:UbiX family flavin prenyltransferase [Prevotellaceae bacterium]
MNDVERKIIVAITGASGFCYVSNLLTKLEETSVRRENIVVIFSENGKLVAEQEAGKSAVHNIFSRFPIYENQDMMVAPASGSSDYDTMIVAPCSMGTLASIASGLASNLITRTADVMLKERRRLILVTRETPLNLIHIENMLAVTRAGGIICPASPSFYFHPVSLNALISTVSERILSLAEINYPLQRFK